MARQRFKIGDQVKFLDATGGGEVVEVVSQDRIRVEDEDGFDDWYSASQLVKPFDDDEEVAVLEEAVYRGKFKIGDRVSPKSADEQGVVQRLDPNGTVHVMMEYGWVESFTDDDLAWANSREQLAALDESIKNMPMDFDLSDNRVTSKKSTKEERWEVDLHVHAITDETDFLKPGELLEIQMQHFKLKLEEAMAKRVKRVVFIHGRGKGKLRSLIREELDAHDNCEYLDGRYDLYGQGATEVIIYQKK